MLKRRVVHACGGFFFFFFEATAVSVKHASLLILLVPVPTSPSSCDIITCGEKQDTEKQQDRGHYKMILSPLPVSLCK